MSTFTVSKFVCPPTLPGDRQCRRISVPDNVYWLGVFNAALLMLADPRMWEQFSEDDLTPDECAEFGMDAYNEWIASAKTGACPMPVRLPPDLVIAQQLTQPSDVNIASAAATWYDLLWMEITAPQTWCDISPATGVITLDLGRYHLRASSFMNITGSSVLRFGASDYGDWQQYGPWQRAYNSPSLDWWFDVTSPVGNDYIIQQYFESAAANGRQAAYTMQYLLRYLSIERYDYPT